jgi:hypothetical protein
MTGIGNALSGGLQHFARNVARIASATCLPFFPNRGCESERVGQWLLEYRMQEFKDEIQRRFIVVVKDDLAMVGCDLNITHWNIAPD